MQLNRGKLGKTITNTIDHEITTTEAILSRARCFFGPSSAKHLKPGDPGYGRPPEGSQSEARAAKASDWVDNEIDKLLKVISDNGKAGPDGKLSITFGQLFILYQDISDSLVGIMMRAKKRSRLRYEGDMLWQGVHDAVCITIL